TLFQESLLLWRELGSEGRNGRAQTLVSLGTVTLLHGEYEKAWAFLEESAALLQAAGEKNYLAYAVRRLGQIASRRGDYEAANAFFRESLELNLAVASSRGVLASLAGLASVLAAHGHSARAVRLFGAVQTGLEDTGETLAVADQAGLVTTLATLRRDVSPAAFEAAWIAGQAMTLEQAVALVGPAPAAAPPSAAATPSLTSLQAAKEQYGGLTARERQVATLIALGRTNREVAAELVVSIKTVEAHTGRIRQKLGVASRAEIALWAAEQGLIPHS
ncbi:MAG: LuxR C-terminal-related transcriptional regulator, partial [Ardenticatenaceae bacterium]